MSEDTVYYSVNTPPTSNNKLMNSFLLGGVDPFLPGGTTSSMGLAEPLLDIENRPPTIESSPTITKPLIQYEDILSRIVTNWSHTLFVFLISFCLLPYYSVAVVFDPQSSQDQRLTRKSAYTIIIFCTSFYAILWLFLGLFFGYYGSTQLMTSSEIFTVLIFYAICCFSEAVLKTTNLIDSPICQQLEVNMHHMTIQAEYVGSDGQLPGDITIGDLTRLIREKIIPRTIYVAIRILSIILGLLFAILVEVFRWKVGSNSEGAFAGLIIYIICGFILRFILATFLFFYLGEAIVQLYSRVYQGQIFNALTSYSQSTTFNVPYFALNSLKNIQAWQTLRSCLLHEYQQPKIYVDVVLSACFALWLPMSLIVGLAILTKTSLTMFIATCILTSGLIFLYLIVCLHLATQTRDNFNQLGVLYLNEYTCTINEPSIHKDLVLNCLGKLRNLIQFTETQAIIFRILGIGINRNFSTFILGLTASLITTAISKFLST